MEYLAHIKEKTGGNTDVQTVREHLRNTASIAEQSLARIGLGNTAYLAGILHDMGKYTVAFQDYLEKGDKAKRGSVIHTFQGCKYILDKFHASDDLTDKITAELIAVAIGSHHGLFDCVDSNQGIGLLFRQNKEGIGYEEAVENYFKDGFSIPEIENRFKAALSEISRITDRIDLEYQRDEEYCFQIGMLERLILSAVIDGDRHDTACFMISAESMKWPQNMESIWNERLQFTENKLSKFPLNNQIAKERAKISDICKRFAENAPGIYELNVPTGGGKTLSSLRYALRHAAKYNKKRIIFTSPLLSILEQNAKVLHEFIGDDRLILEHHSNILNEKDDGEKLDRNELLIEDWNSPVIITTMVQLLNTLFSGKTSCIRRFQALCESVIVIDEVQTVPPKMLSLFNMAVQFLNEQCDATIVLCSATQPAFDQADHPLRNRPEQIVPHDEKIWKAFERTEIISIGNRILEEIPEQVHSIMDEATSLLVVCNKKDEASYLLNQIKDAGFLCFHLSASMCMQHRRDVVEQMKMALDNKEKVVCVSTQVIEAGVDISFERVIRFMAGMDSVVQSAGRCNRNGESENLCPVYVINCTDENLGKLTDIQRGKTSTIGLLEEYKHEPERFEQKLSSDSAIRCYYEKYYSDMNGGAQDFPIQRPRDTLFNLLSTNKNAIDGDTESFERYALWQAFRTAGSLFSVFSDETTDVVVPYGDGKHIIQELCSERALKDENYQKKMIAQAGSYSVSLYAYQLKQLTEKGAIYKVCNDSILVLKPEFYDEMTGVIKEAEAMQYLEV